MVRHPDAQYPPRAYARRVRETRGRRYRGVLHQAPGGIETMPDQVRGRLLEESRAHLGFETQRQGSDLAIERITPCLPGLYSLVTLLAHDRYVEDAYY